MQDTKAPSTTVKSLLRVATAGSVDDGKSTLIGRLLFDSNNIYSDELVSEKSEGEKLAHITDGLRAEREQGITIDVAYRYITTKNRRIILADTPGHEQYTRNMATGASNADLGILLVDATQGLTAQTKRHAFIAALMGVPRLVLAINKMDLIEYREDTFLAIRDAFYAFAAKLNIANIVTIPVSALLGDNVVHKSAHMQWYSGQTLFEYLETVYTDSDRNLIDFRFPVQCVLKKKTERFYAGQIASGTVAVGQKITCLPSNHTSVIAAIQTIDRAGNVRNVDNARAPQSVSLQLSDQLDISRGDMIVRHRNVPSLQNNFEAMLIWMGNEHLLKNRTYILQHTTRLTKCHITDVQYSIAVEELSRQSCSTLKLNEIGRASLSTSQSICFDSYTTNRNTGGFILIDPESNNTVAAGLLIDRNNTTSLLSDSDPTPARKPKAANLHFETSSISTDERIQALGFPAQTYWFTGLPASGKSTLARGFERYLFDSGMPVYRLDGDTVRHGLNEDLGFSKGDRTENIRRLMHVARLFNDAGVSCIVCAISPFDSDRKRAQEVIGSQNFHLIWVSTPLETCEQRDPYGLYKKARAGKIANLTGISAPYEQPANATLELDTSSLEIPACLEKLSRLIKS